MNARAALRLPDFRRLLAASAFVTLAARALFVVIGYQTYDEVFNLLKNGEVDAFALSRDQLNALAKKIPGTKVLDETFKKTVTAVAVPLNHPQSLAFVTKFMTEATSNGILRKAYDTNGLKDAPIRVK